MKNQLLLVLISITLYGCGVKESEYNLVVSQKDSLVNVVNTLKLENDMLKNGENRLVNHIRFYYDNKEYVKALSSIDSLKTYHPESMYFVENEKVIFEIERKAAVILDSIAKAKNDSVKLANINDLGAWELGEYVDNFDEPTGDKYVFSNFYGTFSNSATVGSVLRVCVITSYYDDKYNYSVKLNFDEYSNGTIETNFSDCTYTKVVNKEQRKVYTGYDYYCYYDENNNSISLRDILLEEGEYEFEFRFKYGRKYRFIIDSRGLNNALIKAGMKSLDELIN